MNLLIAALLGVVVGMVAATSLILYLLQKRVDRDLIERRIRAYEEYSECLRALVDLVDAGAGQTENDGERVVDLAWWGVRNFCREFRLSGWILDAASREHLARVVADLEANRCAYEENGTSRARTAHYLAETYHKLDRYFARQKAAQAAEFHRFSYLLSRMRRERTETSPTTDEPPQENPTRAR